MNFSLLFIFGRLRFAANAQCSFEHLDGYSIEFYKFHKLDELHEQHSSSRHTALSTNGIAVQIWNFQNLGVTCCFGKLFLDSRI